MSTRAWLNLALLALLAGLVAVAVYEPGIEPPSEAPALTPLAPGAITRITIARRDQPAFTLEKKADTWRITPQGWAADAPRMNVLLDLAREKSVQRLPAADPARYGLDKPALVVTLNDTRIAFGDTDPIRNHRYVQVGDTVHLIADLHFSAFNGSAASFADPKPLPEDARVESLALPAFTLSRDAQGNYTLSPKREGLSADAPQQLVDEWRHTRALWVEEADGVTPPEERLGRVRITLSGGHTIEYRIVNREPDFVLFRPDLKLRYHFAADQAQRLLELPGASAEGDAGR